MKKSVFTYIYKDSNDPKNIKLNTTSVNFLQFSLQFYHMIFKKLRFPFLKFYKQNSFQIKNKAFFLIKNILKYSLINNPKFTVYNFNSTTFHKIEILCAKLHMIEKLRNENPTEYNSPNKAQDIIQNSHEQNC